MREKAHRRNLVPFICFLLAAVVFLALYHLWNIELGPGEKWPMTKILATMYFEPLTAMFGTAAVCYALEMGGIVRVKRNLAGGIAVGVVVFLIIMLFGLANSASIPQIAAGKAVNLREKSALIDRLYVIYMLNFRCWMVLLVCELMGIGLFWSIGRRAEEK